MIRRIYSWATTKQARAATFAGWFQQLCTIGGASVTIPVVIGVLGDREAGIWFSLQGIIAIFSLSDFGFSMAISRQVAHSFKHSGDVSFPSFDLFHIGSGWKSIGVLYAASRTIFLRVMAIALVLFIVSYQWIIPRTNLLPHRTFETTMVWYLLAGSFSLVFFARLSQSFLDGLGYMYIGRTISGGYQLLCSVFSILVLRLHFGLRGLAVVLLAASLLQLLTMQALLIRIAAGKLIPDYPASRPLIGKLWKVSLPFGLVNTGGYLVGAVQVPLLGALLGPAVVAPIYIALKISQALSSTVLQIVIAQLPFFTQQCAQGHWPQARRRMRETLILGGLSQAVVTLFIYFGSPRLVAWWVGTGHYIGGTVLLVFAVNYLVSSLAGLPAQFVLASGRNPFAISTIVHGVLTLGGMMVLCPRLGLVGAPLAGLIAVILTNFWLSPLQGWRTWQHIGGPERVAVPT